MGSSSDHEDDTSQEEVLSESLSSSGEPETSEYPDNDFVEIREEHDGDAAPRRRQHRDGKKQRDIPLENLSVKKTRRRKVNAAVSYFFIQLLKQTLKTNKYSAVNSSFSSLYWFSRSNSSRRGQKLNYVMGFVSCLLVVIVSSLMITIISNNPVIFLNLAQSVRFCTSTRSPLALSS